MLLEVRSCWTSPRIQEPDWRLISPPAVAPGFWGANRSPLSSGSINQQSVNCLRLFRHFILCAFAVTRLSAGNNKLAKIAMIAMTTNSSMSVKAVRAARSSRSELPHIEIERLLLLVFIFILFFQVAPRLTKQISGHWLWFVVENWNQF